MVEHEGFHREGETRDSFEECVGLKSQGEERGDMMSGTVGQMDML